VIGVLVSGEGSNLQALLDHGVHVACVASNKAGVRALERADAAGLPAAVFELGDYRSREDRDKAMADWLASHGVDLVVLAGYMHLLRPCFLERFPGRVINVHPALLPQFPGAHAIEEALAAGVPVTGATVHYVDEGIDTGDVIVQREVPVRHGDTVETLRARIQAVEHELLPAVVRELCAH
jgi:phosphoribosylglycinamide formyltransferase-1